jgi:hypothetical protein
VHELTDHEIGIYTGYYYFKDNVPDAEKEYFEQFPLWLAWYGMEIKVPAPWTEWTFWQYTDKGDGHAYGVEASTIDLNYFNGNTETFRKRFGLGGELPQDVQEEHSEPFPGVKFHKVFRFGSWCHITQITGGSWAVTKFGLKKVSDVAKSLGAQVVINGGDFSVLHATGLHVVNGIQYQPQAEYEPFINFGADQISSIEPYDSRAKKWNAIAGKRFIVIDGEVSTLNSAAWSEVHPRTLVGVGMDGMAILCVIDGRQEPYSRGVDLYDAAAVMVEFGAIEAIDLDGGGSSAMWVKDRIVNSPIEAGVPGQERLVGDHIVWFSGEGQPEPPQNNGGNMQYKAVWSKGVSVRRSPSTSQTSIRTIAYGTIVDVTQNNIPDSDDPTNENKRWVKLTDGNYAASDYPDGYGVPKARMELVGGTPPPPSEPPASEAHTIVVDFAGGITTVTVDGQAYTK